MGFPEASHENKMEVRILIPFILRYLYVFDESYLPIFIYIINLFSLYLFSLQLIRFQHEKLPGIGPSWLLPLLFTTIYTGISFVMDYWPMFDGIAFLLISIAMNMRSYAFKTCLLLCALFIDERSIFGAAMILMVDLESNYMKAIASGFSLLFAYLAIRMMLTYYYGLNSIFKPSADLSFFKYIHKDNFNFFITALINCFKGLWLLPVLTYFKINRRLSIFNSFSYVTITMIFLASLFGSLLVADFTRSFSYGFPFFLYSLYYLHRMKINADHLRITLQVIIFSNILTVTYFFHSENEIYNTTDIITKVGIYFLK
jgi:hypothetical protein